MWPAIIGGIATLGAAFLGNKGAEDRNEAQAAMTREQMEFNREQAEINRQFNAQQAGTARDWQAIMATADMSYQNYATDRQMAFQREMSSTAYQRAVQDMESAGLNPMLAYSQGGASSPAGAAGHGSTGGGSPQASSGAASSPGVPSFENEMVPGINSAMAVARTVSDLMSAEQARTIKNPLEALATAATEVIGELKKAIGPLSQQFSELIRRIEDQIKSAPVGSREAMKAAGQAVDAVSRAVDEVKGAVESGGRSVGSTAKRAMDTVRNAPETVRRVLEDVERQVGEIIHGKRGVEPPPSKGKVPRDAQRRLREYEWKFNYRP